MEQSVVILETDYADCFTIVLTCPVFCVYLIFILHVSVVMWWCYWQDIGVAIHRLWVRVLSTIA